MAGTHNPLLPEMATVIETVQETHNIKTFRVRFDDEEKMKNFTFQPGQVGQLSVFGVGESTFVINSSPTRMDYLQFSVMKAPRPLRTCPSSPTCPSGWSART